MRNLRLSKRKRNANTQNSISRAPEPRETHFREGSGTVLSPADQAMLYNPTEAELKEARRRDRHRVL